MTNNYQLKLEDVLTLTEIEEVFGIKTVTVKKAIRSGRLNDFEYRKSGATWLVTKAAILRLWNYKLAQ